MISNHATSIEGSCKGGTLRLGTQLSYVHGVGDVVILSLAGAADWKLPASGRLCLKGDICGHSPAFVFELML